MNYREEMREGRTVYLFDDGRYFYRRDKADAHALKLVGHKGSTVVVEGVAVEGLVQPQIDRLTLTVAATTPLTATPSLVIGKGVDARSVPLPPIWSAKRDVHEDRVSVVYTFEEQAREAMLTLESPGAPLSVLGAGVVAAAARVLLPAGEPDHSEP